MALISDMSVVKSDPQRTLVLVIPAIPIPACTLYFCASLWRPFRNVGTEEDGRTVQLNFKTHIGK